MVRKWTRWIVAALVLMLAGFAATPGCKLKLCKGNDCGEGAAGGEGVGDGGSGAAGGEGGGAAEDPFQNADPVQVNREGLRASAASYLLQGTVQQAAEFQGLDPDSIDDATMQQLVDNAWPDALQQAESWLSTLDPSVFEAAVHPSKPYCNGLGCPNQIYCDSEYYKKSIRCSLQACGDAACKVCPDWFGALKNLVITAWCSYVCMDGETVLGSAAYVVTRAIDFQMCLLP